MGQMTVGVMFGSPVGHKLQELLEDRYPTNQATQTDEYKPGLMTRWNKRAGPLAQISLESHANVIGVWCFVGGDDGVYPELELMRMDRVRKSKEGRRAMKTWLKFVAFLNTNGASISADSGEFWLAYKEIA
jgi:hypothetical protein